MEEVVVEKVDGQEVVVCSAVELMLHAIVVTLIIVMPVECGVSIEWG